MTTGSKIAIGCFSALGVVSLLVMIFWGIAIYSGSQAVDQAKRAPSQTKRSTEERGNDPEEFIAKFGAPDIDYVSDVEQPKPLIITRYLEYRRPRVRVFYTAGMNARKPYRWSYIGITDPEANQKITPEEAARRLRSK